MRKLLTPRLRVADLSNEDTRLLQMTLSDGEMKRQAWSEWRATVDFDTLTTGCLLVPAGFHSMDGSASGAVAERMRGAFRKNWLLTQLLRERVFPLLKQIDAAKIDCVLGDDLALALGSYPNPGMRPIYEVALYCRAADRSKLYSLLHDTGINAVKEHSWQLTDQAFLRLRRREPDSTVKVLDGASAPYIPVLGPTSQFWSTFQAARPQTILRFLDLGILARDHGQHVDWTFVEARAAKCGLLGSLQETLAFFVNTLGLNVPAEAQLIAEYNGTIAASSALAQHARAFASGVRRRVQV